MPVILFALLIAAGCSTPPRIVVFGDSLAHQLADAASVPVVNAGVPSERVSQALVDPAANPVAGETRIHDVVLVYRPSHVIVMIGANDVLEGTWQESQGMGAGWLDKFEVALERVIRTAQDHGARVTVLTIPPQRLNGRRNRNGVAVRIPEANMRIVALAAYHGAALVDAHAIIAADTDRFLSTDDVHLTPEGYAELWRWLK